MVLAGGGLIALAIVLARASRHRTLSLRRKSEEQLERETHDFAGAVREQNRPVPLLVWIVTVGYFVWAVAYVIFSAGKGV
jgi:membrane associated rhomboid family serine protease